MNWVYRRSTGDRRNSLRETAAQAEIRDNQWKLEVNVLQRRYNIHPRMIINGDETMVLYVPSFKYTMEERGATDVMIVGFDGKSGNTVTLTGNAMGEMLPTQVIYKGMQFFLNLLLVL